jgi:hypothetical protein
MLYTTNSNQLESQNNKVDNTNSNKTVIILLIAIIIAGAILGFLVARQNNESNSISIETEQTITEQQENIPIDSPMSMGIRPGDVPVPDIIITQEQLLSNNNMNFCWTVVDGVVYDITEYIRSDTRFLGDISEVCGKDGTKALQEGVDVLLLFEGRGLFEIYSRPVGIISP